MQQPVSLGPPTAQFFHDGRYYSVHREGQTVVITFGEHPIRKFQYGTERTPLEQAAQWRIEDVDPLLILDESEPQEGDDAET